MPPITIKQDKPKAQLEHELVYEIYEMVKEEVYRVKTSKPGKSNQVKNPLNSVADQFNSN